MTDADHVMIALLVLSALLILWVAALCWWANHLLFIIRELRLDLKDAADECDRLEDRLELVDQ